LNLSQQSFRALGVSAEVADALTKRGLVAPFRIQELVVPQALEGRDILAKAPTGSGKTLAFALPIVERIRPEDGAAAALVLVPTRELAQQVAEDLETLAPARGLKVAAVYGGAPIRAQAKEAKEAQIVIATPGRLFDLMERRLVSVGDTRIIVLDEADRMLDMGFKPQVERIIRRVPADPRRCSFPPRSTARSASSPARTRATRLGSRPVCRASASTAKSTTSSSRSLPTRRSRR